ncbi:hypothetical protein CHN51_06485 [Sphingorhabdus sp. YGSMI21]|nr:hypothetical protein CHN51_06485 [Sphingorhabdus sp. YGSMI21]
MIAHIAGFAWIALEPAKIIKGSVSDFLHKLEAVALPGSMSLGLIVIASLVLLGLVPPNWRDRIIHLRWQNPLPGCRAFTSIGPAASHVDMDGLSARLGQLPSDAAEQNKLFYRIYKPLRDDVGVCDSHRRYLAARDIGTITALLVVPLSLLAFVATDNAGRSMLYGLFLLATYLFCAIAAKNYSLRMVQHVLALSAAQPETAVAS